MNDFFTGFSFHDLMSYVVEMVILFSLWRKGFLGRDGFLIVGGKKGRIDGFTTTLMIITILLIVIGFHTTQLT